VLPIPSRLTALAAQKKKGNALNEGEKRRISIAFRAEHVRRVPRICPQTGRFPGTTRALKKSNDVMGRVDRAVERSDVLQRRDNDTFHFMPCHATRASALRPHTRLLVH
jgi:hypothetical protein